MSESNETQSHKVNGVIYVEFITEFYQCISGRWNDTFEFGKVSPNLGNIYFECTETYQSAVIERRLLSGNALRQNQ